MVFKGIIAAAAAVALAASPAVAAVNAAPLSIAPATETAEGSQLGGASLLIVLLAVVAAGAGIWAIADNDDEAPVSA